MAYRFKLNENPEQAARRIGLEQIERAMLALSASKNADSTIHETRKCLKRIRALLRLVRPGLVDGVFHDENARYRDIARRLSTARDAHILTETLLKLEPLAAKKADTDAIALAMLQASTQQSDGTPQCRAGVIASAHDDLSAARPVMAQLTLAESGVNAIETGLRDCYRRGTSYAERAYKTRTDEAFHEWRKSVQLHWRHMALLSRAWPDLFSARIEAARELSQILGDAQDLSVLMAYIKTLAPGDLPKAAAARVVGLAQQRQDHLRAAAQPRGAQLFSLSPKSLAGSVLDAWQAARTIEDLNDDGAARPPVAQIAANAPSIKAAKKAATAAAGAKISPKPRKRPSAPA